MKQLALGFAVLLTVAIFSACGSDGSVPAAAKPAASASQSTPVTKTTPTGAYAINMDKTTCTKDKSDADNLHVEIKDNQVTSFELNDDVTEKVQSYKNDVITFTFEEKDSPNCNLKIANGIASGACTDGKTTCDIYYEKCSDDPKIEEKDGKACPKIDSSEGKAITTMRNILD